MILIGTIRIIGVIHVKRCCDAVIMTTNDPPDVTALPPPDELVPPPPPPALLVLVLPATVFTVDNKGSILNRKVIGLR
jgi:hypothetical protein